MRSSRTITLFTLQPEPRRSSSGLVVSAVVHAGAIAVVLSAFLWAPQFRLNTPDVYMMQHVALNMPLPPIPKAGGSGSMYPKSAPSSSGSETAAHDEVAAPASSRIHFMKRKLAPQTLINPNVDPEKMLPKETPVPAMLLWSGHRPKVQMITPPKPQLPNITLQKPKLHLPNEAEKIAELNLAPAPFQSKLPMPFARKTSPVILNRQLDVQRIPETGSIAGIEATPAAVLSASDLHMNQGTVSLPAANQSAEGSDQGGLGTGKTPNSLLHGAGDSADNGTGKGVGHGQTSGTGKVAGTGTGGSQGASGSGNSQAGAGNGPAGHSPGTGNGNGQGAGHNAGSGSGPTGGQGTGDSDYGTVTRINVPKNGQYNVVVVGSSLDEQYPETAEVWKGRLAYSVYLHVGLQKSWILQYSLPRAADSASAGSAKLDAPWPFYIVRPNLNPDDASSDAVMVHGFVDEAGHFEKLSVVFPTDMGYAREQLVLTALQQWQFRAGLHNGQIAKLEVLLIIPEVTN